MVIHLKNTQTLTFSMEDRFGRLLRKNKGKAIQLAQVMADAGKDFLEEDDSPVGEAFRHYQNFQQATNETLFEDELAISNDDADQIVLKLLIKQ